MLTPELIGPGLTIDFASPSEFVALNRARYPQLDPDFITQICFEHPERFNELLPRFHVESHSVVRIVQPANWVYDNVRHENGDALTFWYAQFDDFLVKNEQEYSVFTHMIAHGTWPFPPVVVRGDVALALGAPPSVGTPYHLIEGTHRVSYLCRMLELDLVAADRPVTLLEVTA